ncbi:MAG: CDP-alcohol phosphatidyltransferase family protein [Gammaproteobacteria bacterium]
MDGTTPGVRLSLLRGLRAADVFTLANGALGTLALILTLIYARDGARHTLFGAAFCLLAALVCDICDGRVARAGGGGSSFGRELDSLADIISFGVAPAAIAFAAGLDAWLDVAALVFFVLCGLARLARYNVTAEALAEPGRAVRYYQGTPIPTSIVPLLMLLTGFVVGELGATRMAGIEFHLMTLAFVVSGCLMVSGTLRIPKL